MEEVGTRNHNRHGVLSFKQEHLGEQRGGQESGLLDKTQTTTWDSNGWSSWRHAWARLVVAIIKWAASWNKGHGDKVTTTSMTLACYRSNHGGNTGTSDGNGKCDNTTTTHSDARRGVTKAQGDTNAPKRKNVVTEQQQRMLDTEVAQYAKVKEAKTNALTSYAGSMLHKQSETMVHKGAGNTEKYNVESDSFKSREGGSPEAAGEVIKVHDERLGKSATTNLEECEMEVQMDLTGDYNENMDDADNDCIQAGDIDGRLWNETQKSMVDTECRNNVTPPEKATQAEMIYEGSFQCCTEETETHSARVGSKTKPVQLCDDKKWLLHKTQVTTWAFMWWRTWKRVWTRVVSLFFTEWVLKWKKGHGEGDKGTNISYKRTSDRWYHDAGTGTSDGNENCENWDAVSATGHTDGNKLDGTSAQTDTMVPKRNDAAKEHRHGRLDTEAADTGVKSGKGKGRNRCARSTSYKKDAALMAHMVRTEQNNIRSGTDKDRGRYSHMVDEEAYGTQVGDSCEQASEHVHEGDEQMACATWTLGDTEHTRKQRVIRTRWTNTMREQEVSLNVAQGDTGYLREQRAHSNVGGDVDRTSDGDSPMGEGESIETQVEWSGKHGSENEGECEEQSDTDDVREQRAIRTLWLNSTRHCLNRWKHVTRTNRDSEDGTTWETERHASRNNARRRARKAAIRAAQEEMAPEQHHSGYCANGDKVTSGRASSHADSGDISHMELEVEKDARRLDFLRASHEQLSTSLGQHDELVKEIEARICRAEIRQLKKSIAGLEDKLRKGDQTP